MADASAQQLEAVGQQLRGAEIAEAGQVPLLTSAWDAISVVGLDGRILKANGGWKRILGFEAEQLMGRNLADFAVSCAPAFDFAAFLRLLEAGGGELLAPLCHASAAPVMLSFSVSPLATAEGAAMLLIGRDVTEAWNTRQALELSEERYRSLVVNLPEVVWTSNDRGQPIFVGPGAPALTGLSAEQIAAAADRFDFWVERIHPDDRSGLLAAFERLFRGGETLDLEFRWQHAEGAWRWLHLRARLAPRGGKVLIDGLASDVTARRKLEEQMRQAQKLEAVGRLVGAVAHDFNNILAAMLSSAHFLISDLEPADPRRADALEIRLGAERAAALTRQLLAFSRKQALQPTELDPGQVVLGLEKMLRRLIGEDITFSVKTPAEPWTVMADAGQLEQVVMNLAVNARDAMPHGGDLQICIAHLSLRENDALCPPAVPGDWVVLSVKDTGCGMNEETRRRAFEPFFTTKGKGTGTGLGLSTCYGIVEQSGGKIVIDSEVGKGTEFRVLLPRMEGPSVPAVNPDTMTRSLRGHERILVVEDDPQVREGMKRTLVSYGYEVVTAANGEEALSLFAAHVPIDLVVSDVVIPGQSGPSMVERLMQCPNPPRHALFMSGYTDHPMLTGADRSALDFIQKPFSPATLAQKVREVLDGR